MWIQTRFSGVRYREHPTRKHGIKPDRYFTIRYQRDGERREEGLGWTSEDWTAEDAALQLAGLKKAHTTGTGPTRLSEIRKEKEEREKQEQQEKERLERESITFGQYFTDSYYPIAKTNKKPESYRKEKEHFNNWLIVMETMPIKDIFPLHLEKVKKNMLEAKRAPRSLQYVFATFRQIWNMAKRDGLVHTEFPGRQVKLPKVSNERLRFLSYDEADVLLEKLKDRSAQLHDITLLSLHCGLRFSEICRLKWQDVDLERGTITVHGKGGKNRPVPMTDEARDMLEGMGPGSPNSLIFTDRNGGKIRKISNAFGRAVKDLGFNDGVLDRLNKFTFHCCRHTFASWLVIGGESLYTVQKLLGHSSPITTQRYAHLCEETLQGAVRSLEKRISKFKKEKEAEKTKEAQAININGEK